MENFLNTSTILSSGIINTDILETNLINITILNLTLMEAINQYFPLILIFVVFYFFILRPQMNRAKKEKKFAAVLK